MPSFSTKIALSFHVKPSKTPGKIRYRGINDGFSNLSVVNLMKSKTMEEKQRPNAHPKAV